MSGMLRGEFLTIDQRFHEVARILAIGVQRLRTRAALATEETPQNPENSAVAGLEVGAETRLSVHRG